MNYLVKNGDGIGWYEMGLLPQFLDAIDHFSSRTFVLHALIRTNIHQNQQLEQQNTLVAIVVCPQNNLIRNSRRYPNGPRTFQPVQRHVLQ